ERQSLVAKSRKAKEKRFGRVVGCEAVILPVLLLVLRSSSRLSLSGYISSSTFLAFTRVLLLISIGILTSQPHLALYLFSFPSFLLPAFLCRSSSLLFRLALRPPLSTFLLNQTNHRSTPLFHFWDPLLNPISIASFSIWPRSELHTSCWLT
ncbi:hypothetical protein BZA70DRAFT_293059, partial [Myxozyma melibiosi]